MENGVEALMIAFAVLTLVIALSISISMLGKVNACSEAILNNVDRENDYLYVEDAGLQRTVGLETIIPTLYRSFTETYEVRFVDKNGKDYEIYEKNKISQNSVKLEDINIIKSANKTDEFFKGILYGGDAITIGTDEFVFNEGLYGNLNKATEYLGEYTITHEETNSNVPDADVNEETYRMIVYQVLN